MPEPMVAFVLITVVPLLLYGILICRYIFYWEKYPEYLPGSKKNAPGLSVIIPFRNEQKCLPGILEDLSFQDYPADRTEIILVNDQSLDNSATLIQEYCNRYDHFRLIHLEGEKAGKKEALHAGIQTAAHELIVTMDADCRAGKQWLSSIASFYQDFLPAMIIGLVKPDAAGNGLLSYFQQLESISLTGAGAASAIGGNPIYCSGANLCYRKEFYFECNDPMMKSIASGDDTFLLLQLKKHYRTDIKVLKSKNAWVSTKTEANLMDFIRQRSRWISKSIHYRDPEILCAALVVLLANLAIVMATAFLVLGYPSWLFLILIITKLLLDGYFIVSLSTYFGLKFRLAAYIVSGIMYPFYLLISIARAFILPVDWKGRKFEQ